MMTVQEHSTRVTLLEQKTTLQEWGDRLNYQKLVCKSESCLSWTYKPLKSNKSGKQTNVKLKRTKFLTLLIP